MQTGGNAIFSTHFHAIKHHEKALSIHGLYSGSNEMKIRRVGCIYKLYAHSNHFNDFSELIVYVYA